MNPRLLDFIEECARVRVFPSAQGRIYARIIFHSSQVVLLDQVAQLAGGHVRRVRSTFRVCLAAHPTVIRFCDAVLPHLRETSPLYAELRFARAIAAAPWYDRYEVVENYLKEGGETNGNVKD